MNLLLIRHAQSANNLLYAQTGGSEGRHPDPPLTDLGHAQAAALAQFARSDATFGRVTHLYSSLMRRSVQTAAPLAQVLGLPVQGLAQAHEAGGIFGKDEAGERQALAGAAHADLLADNPALLWPPELDMQEPWAGGFEHYADDDRVLQQRAAALLRQLRGHHAPAGEAGETVALVTHGHFTQYLLREVTGHGSAYFRVFNTATTLLTLHGPETPAEWGPLVVWVNRFDHLAPEQVSV